MNSLRPVFRGRPWLTWPVWLAGFPLYLLIGAVEGVFTGVKEWLREGRDIRAAFRKDTRHE